MSEGTIVRKTIEQIRAEPSRTDWARVAALTDAEIAQATAEDPDAGLEWTEVANDPDDAPEWTEQDSARAVTTTPLDDTVALVAIEREVSEWFRAQGHDWAEQVNAVLRAHMRSAGSPSQA